MVKRDPTIFLNAGLFDSNHLALHLGQFRSGLLVAANKERRRPKHDDGNARGDLVACPLVILSASKRSRTRRYGLSLKTKLLASVIAVGNRRDVGGRNIRGFRRARCKQQGTCSYRYPTRHGRTPLHSAPNTSSDNPSASAMGIKAFAGFGLCV